MQDLWGVWILSCEPLYLPFKSPKKNVEALRGEHAFAFLVYVVDASYCGSVHFREYVGSSEGDSVSFPWCFMISTSMIQYS
jgi:hypothetical protein